MRSLFCTCLAASAMAFALSGEASAQSASFDGTYVGVSASFRGAMTGSGHGCPNFPAPAPLTIAGGHAQVKWSESTLQGDVTPQGALVMRAPSAGQMSGQINAQGRLTGSYTGFCAYDLAWQRR